MFLVFVVVITTSFNASGLVAESRRSKVDGVNGICVNFINVSVSCGSSSFCVKNHPRRNSRLMLVKSDGRVTARSPSASADSVDFAASVVVL